MNYKRNFIIRIYIIKIESSFLIRIIIDNIVILRYFRFILLCIKKIKERQNKYSQINKFEKITILIN